MKNAVVLTVFVSLALMFGYNVQQFFISHRAPFEYISASIENPQVRVGGDARFVFVFDRIRYCPTTLSRFIVKKDSNTIVRRIQAEGGATILGRHRVVSPIRMVDDNLENLPPGRYVKRVFNHSDCTDGRHTVAVPEIEFEIVP